MSEKTVKVKLKTSRAGNNFVQERGDEIEVGAAEAQRMIAKGQAALVKDETSPSQK